jgi:peptide/nickel transport system ATP-binding protein
VIVARDLTVRYGTRVAASVPVLRVAPGEVVAIAGRSGAGKTSVALAVLGLAGDEQASVSGTVTVDGLRVPAAAATALMGYLPQDPRGALPPATRLGPLITAALRRHGVPRGERRPRVEEALRTVRIDPALLRRYPHEVSGGQAQRFAVAVLLALRARYLVVDEPTSALDRINQVDLVTELGRLRDAGDTGILLVSHDLGVIRAVADRILVMHRSRVVEEGGVPEVLDDPAHPATRALVAGARPPLPRRGGAWRRGDDRAP